MSTQPEAVELITYAFRSAVPQIRIVAPSSPQELFVYISQKPLVAVVTSFRLYGQWDGLLLAQKLRAGGFSNPILMLSNSDELASRSLSGIDEFVSFEHWNEIPSRVTALVEYLAHRQSNEIERRSSRII